VNLLFEPFVMIALLICFGTILRLVGIMNAKLTTQLSSLVIKVAFPALLFTSVYANVNSTVLRLGLVFPFVAFFTCIVLAITSSWTGKRFGLTDETLSTYTILCTNGNNIFLPVPIIMSLFGSENLVYAFLFELGAALFYWTYGVSLFQRDAKFRLKNILNPNLVALVAGSVFGLLAVPIPQALVGAIDFIADITVGSAMLIIGSLLVNVFQTKKRWRREVFGIVFHRFLVSPVIGIVYVTASSLQYPLSAVLLLLMSMPCLASTALVASTFNADEDLAALGVAVSTIVSLFFVPVVLMLAGIRL